MQFGGYILVDTVVAAVARARHTHPNPPIIISYPPLQPNNYETTIGRCDSPAFVGLFYLSSNHIKFTYLIKEIKLKELNNQIMFGCVVIGITLSIIDIYLAQKILVHEGSGRGLIAISTGGFCGYFCINRIAKFHKNSDKDSK